MWSPGAAPDPMRVTVPAAPETVASLSSMAYTPIAVRIAARLRIAAAA